MKRSVIISVFAAAIMAALPAKSQALDPFEVAGEFLGFHYAMEVLDNSVCGPVDGGPYGDQAALAFLGDFLTFQEHQEVQQYVEIARAENKAYFQDVFDETMQTFKDNGFSQNEACTEARTIYLNLFKESKNTVRSLR